jgi:hypothetical protein
MWHVPISVPGNHPILEELILLSVNQHVTYVAQMNFLNKANPCAEIGFKKNLYRRLRRIENMNSVTGWSNNFITIGVNAFYISLICFYVSVNVKACVIENEWEKRDWQNN